MTKLEQTLDNIEKKIYRDSIKNYRKTNEYNQIISLQKTWQHKPKNVGEYVAQGYAKGKVLGYRETNNEIKYRNKYFKQKYWDGN